MALHSMIKEHAAINMEPEDREAVERLIEKLILSKVQYKPTDRDQEIAALIQTFWTENTDFKNKLGYFSKNTGWLSAEDEKIPSHVRYQNYSLPYTKMLGCWHA
jgi:hypothetical protein